MALDGFVVAAAVYELNRLLAGQKIEKIYQPEPDELVFLIRAQGKNQRLLLSANSQYPRVHLIRENRENPALPPGFCMLLRKHLQGGRILSIEQPELERIVQIKVESYDELNVLTYKTLIVEIMGKHSNIILVDGESQRVLDAIKRVSFDMSRYRQVLPGVTYELPPSQNKLNPLNSIDLDLFAQTLAEQSQMTVLKRLYGAFTGVSPLLAREICFRANLAGEQPVFSLTEGQYQQLYQVFCQMVADIRQARFAPQLYRDPATEELKAFHVFTLTHLSYYPAEQPGSVSQLLEGFYFHNDFVQRMRQKNQSLRKNLTQKLDRLTHKIENLREDLKQTEKAEEIKRLGDLLTANLHLLKGKEAEVRVIDYYDPELAEIVIPLDKRLTAAQNAQRYFKQYNKYKTAVGELTRQMAQAQEETRYLEQILLFLDQMTQLSDLEEITKELVQTGYLRGKPGKKQKSPASRETYLVFETSDGYPVWVGKNNLQNDEITFKLANRDDLWLHVKDLPGSHTILRTKGGAYSDQALLEAATLAAYYSKAREATKVQVDYTLRKNVKKPNGAKPGMVVYDPYQTLIVDGSLAPFPHLNR